MYESHNLEIAVEGCGKVESAVHDIRQASTDASTTPVDGDSHNPHSSSSIHATIHSLVGICATVVHSIYPHLHRVIHAVIHISGDQNWTVRGDETVATYAHHETLFHTFRLFIHERGGKLGRDAICPDHDTLPERNRFSPDSIG